MMNATTAVTKQQIDTGKLYAELVRKVTVMKSKSYKRYDYAVQKVSNQNVLFWIVAKEDGTYVPVVFLDQNEMWRTMGWVNQGVFVTNRPDFLAAK